MRQPDFLKPGDRIGIIAPARKVSVEELHPGLEILRGWGYQCAEGKYLYGDCNQYSGTDKERTADFQSMINDKSIRAIIAARGGYGCMRIVDQLDFKPLQSSPKWFCGFSDMTVIHAYLQKNLQMQSLHSVMVFNMMPDRFNKEAVESLGKALSGIPLHYEYKFEAEFKQFQRNGKANGEVVGGNLSLLYALSGSNCDMDLKGKILMLEDLDEYLYHLDRMMMQLKRSGKLKDLAALVIGGMTDMKDNTIPFGKNATEIIAEAVAEYKYPLCFGFPCGHQPDNRALFMGREAELIVDEKIKLNYI
jgi:muramoyltetrapeptide carboxypeptidase